MIQKAIESLNARISSMAWIDRFGGLTYIISRSVETEKGIVTQKYPVSLGITPEACFESGDYLSLVPDSKYYSVAYYEQVSDVNSIETPLSRGRKKYKNSCSVRFFAWLNLKKIGISDPTTTGDFTLQTLNRLKKDHVSVDSNVKMIEITNTRVETKSNTIKVMEQYTYDDLQKLVLYPFDVFSIVFDISWFSPVDCAEDVLLGTEINC